MLNPTAPRVLISQQGERVEWWQALPCDCRDPGDPTYGDERSCDKCERGYVYRLQKLPAGAKALIVRQRREYLHSEVGMIRVGDLTITTMPDEIPVSDFDKIVLLDRAATKKEILRRGATASDALGEAHPVAVQTVADGSQVYVEGEDWRFDAEAGAVVWIEGGDEPEAVFTAVYTHAPEYWYTGAMMTESRPMPGYDAQWPKSGLLQTKFPEADE